MEPVLYTYYRSSAAYRVRIGMNLKGLTADQIPIHLTRGGGEQLKPDFVDLNPLALVPVMIDGALRLSQSLAILEYLEERTPSPALLPAGLEDRARVRQLALMVACDIHPLNNLRVLKYLTGKLAVTEAAKLEWIGHWVRLGLAAFEAELASSTNRGQFCVGDTPTIADCCLIPQVFGARRFDVDMAPYPLIRQIEERCAAIAAFSDAHPAAQPDAE